MQYAMQMAYMGASGGGGGGGSALSEFVKTGQRQSPAWKTSWYSYCALNGTGMVDPGKYDETFISGFIDFIGNIAAQELTAQAEEAGIDVEAIRNSKRPLPMGGEAGGGGGWAAQQPAARRPRTNAAAAANGASGDPE